MKFLIHFTLPPDPFNTYVREGTAQEKLAGILEAIQPEAVYFSEYDGQRSGILVVNIDSASQIPGIAEPLFLTFNATIRLRVAMTPEDLAASNLQELGG